MPRTNSPEINELLATWENGDRDILQALTPLIYDELRRIARKQLRRIPSARSLQTTALVYETFLELQHRLVDRIRFGAVARRQKRDAVNSGKQWPTHTVAGSLRPRPDRQPQSPRGHCGRDVQCGAMFQGSSNTTTELLSSFSCYQLYTPDEK
jgi:hypothetical protein